MGAAAEAVIDALLLVDMEARGFLEMKRANSLSMVVELNRLSHQRRQGYRPLHSVDVFPRDGLSDPAQPKPGGAFKNGGADELLDPSFHGRVDLRSYDRQSIHDGF